MAEREGPQDPSRRRFFKRAANFALYGGLFVAMGGAAGVFFDATTEGNRAVKKLNKIYPQHGENELQTAEKQVDDFNAVVSRHARAGDKQGIEQVVSQVDPQKLRESYQVLDYEERRARQIADFQEDLSTVLLGVGVAVGGLVMAGAGVATTTRIEKRESRERYSKPASERA